MHLISTPHLNYFNLHRLVKLLSHWATLKRGQGDFFFLSPRRLCTSSLFSLWPFQELEPEKEIWGLKLLSPARQLFPPYRKESGFWLETKQCPPRAWQRVTLCVCVQLHLAGPERLERSSSWNVKMSPGAANGNLSFGMCAGGNVGQLANRRPRLMTLK